MSVLKCAPSQYGSGCSVAKPRRRDSIAFMNRPSLIRKSILAAIITAAVPATIYVIAIAHVAWGDQHYQQKGDYQTTRQATLDRIDRLDTQITIVDQEIIFAESNREKSKWEAIKAIHKRKKEELREKLK